MITVKNLTFNQAGDRVVILTDANGNEQRLCDKDFCNLRINGGPIENGRVSRIGSKGFEFDTRDGRYPRFLFYSRITDIWNIH